MTTTGSLDLIRQALLDQHPDRVDEPTLVALKILAILERHHIEEDPDGAQAAVMEHIVNAINLSYGLMQTPTWFLDPVLAAASNRLEDEFGDEIDKGGIPLN